MSEMQGPEKFEQGPRAFNIVRAEVDGLHDVKNCSVKHGKPFESLAILLEEICSPELSVQPKTRVTASA